MANKHVLSVEIGSSLTRICEVDYKVKNPKIYKSFMMNTPDGVMNDGVVKPTEEYIRDLKAQLSSHNMKSKQVVFSITSTRIASREILIPKVKENRIAAIVSANASDYFPVDLSEYELAHIVLDTVKEGPETEKYKVMVLAVAKSMLEGYERLAASCGLNIVAIDYSGNSLYQMMKDECKEGINMIVKVDESSSLVTILENQSLLLQRTVSYGINEVIDAYRNKEAKHYDYLSALKALSEKNCFQPQPVENTKEDTPASNSNQEAPNTGETQVTNADSLDDGEYQETLEDLLAEAFAYTMRGISRIYDYQNSRNQQKQVTKVFLTGLGAKIKGLDQFMEDRLGVNVVIPQLDGEYHFDRHFPREEADQYIVCLGAALAPLGITSHQKDSKSGDLQSKKSSAYAVTILAVCIAASVAIMAFAAIPYLMLSTQNKQKRLQVEELSDAVAVYDEYIMTKNAHSFLQTAYEYTKLPTEDLNLFIDELEKKMPKGLYLTSFSANKEGVSFSIVASSKQQATDALLQLRSFESLVNVKVNEISDTRDETDSGSVSFTVTADYVNAKYDTPTTSFETGTVAGEAQIFE